jgi:hypothetical protein
VIPEREVVMTPRGGPERGRDAAIWVAAWVFLVAWWWGTESGS